MFEKNLVHYKANPFSQFIPWPYMPPTPKTLEVLKREADANHPRDMRRFMSDRKKGIKTTVPHKFALFFGEKVWGFKFLKSSKEWNVEKGWKDHAAS